MDMLQGILGGSKRQQTDDFIKRYQTGAPWDGISDQEAIDRYQEIAPNVPPDVYEQSAREAFERLTPEQRVEFGRYVQQRARQEGVPIQDFDQDGIDDRFQDSGQLASMTSRMHQQQPGLLGSLLGGAGGAGFGGMLSGMLGGSSARGGSAQGGVGGC
ncbi:MAG: hypothetical protein H0V04_04605 [Chloroflexi bacterium]|nr:hypothetical protein [Chloroflexota bacterium]